VNGKVDIGGLEWAFHNLGDLYFDQDKLAEAEKMYIRALQSDEESLGTGPHIDTHNGQQLGPALREPR